MQQLDATVTACEQLQRLLTRAALQLASHRPRQQQAETQEAAAVPMQQHTPAAAAKQRAAGKAAVREAEAVREAAEAEARRKRKRNREGAAACEGPARLSILAEAAIAAEFEDLRCRLQAAEAEKERLQAVEAENKRLQQRVEAMEDRAAPQRLLDEALRLQQAGQEEGPARLAGLPPAAANPEAAENPTDPRSPRTHGKPP